MELNNSFGYLLNISARLIKRELDKELKQYGITTAQWSVLKLLSVENHLTQADIADKLNSDRATVGTVLDKLIKKNYISKTMRVEDRRSYCVELLPTTRKLIEILSKQAQNANQQALKGLSQNEIQLFNSCLKKVISNLGDDKDVMEI